MAGTTPLSPTSAAQRGMRFEQQLQQLQQDQATFATMVNREVTEAKSRMMQMESMIRDREEAVRLALDRTAADRARDLAKVVSDATSEFTTQRQTLQGLTAAVQVEFNKLQQQIGQGGGESREDGGNRGGKSFIPVKELKPAKLCKEEQWRDWSENFA